MKAKIKLRALESGICSIAGCKRKWVCGTHPKGKMKQALFLCEHHLKRKNDLNLWNIWKLPKPEKVVRLKSEQKIIKKQQGKPAWQGILDAWFKKGKYPAHKFMNIKRWNYWFSIGGKKPEGNSRNFKKEKSWTAKAMDEMIAITPEPKKKTLKAKVRRKK